MSLSNRADEMLYPTGVRYVMTSLLLGYMCVSILKEYTLDTNCVQRSVDL